MSGKRNTAASLFILLFLTSLVLLPHYTVEAQTKTLIVPDKYPTIQNAINSANNGDTIYVKDGIYRERLTISKSLNLRGEDAQGTVINGGNIGDVIQVRSTKVAISGFTLENGGTSNWAGHGYPDCCIDIQDSSSIVISNTTLRNATVGIWCYNSNYVAINDNLVFNTATMGIIAYGGRNVTIYSCLVRDCGLVGIHLDGSSLSFVINNTVVDCSEGIDVEKSNQNLIKQCLLLNNYLTLSFTGSSNNQVQYCTISNGYIGAGFHESNDNTLTQNSFINNTKQVVPDLDFSSPNLESSYAESHNIWDNGKAGNYWSNYNGSGSYVIDENNIDHYPLTQPVNINAMAPTPTPYLLPRNPPHLDPIYYLIPVSIIVAVIVMSILLYSRHRKTQA